MKVKEVFVYTSDKDLHVKIKACMGPILYSLRVSMNIENIHFNTQFIRVQYSWGYVWNNAI